MTIQKEQSKEFREKWAFRISILALFFSIIGPLINLYLLQVVQIKFSGLTVTGQYFCELDTSVPENSTTWYRVRIENNSIFHLQKLSISYQYLQMTFKGVDEKSILFQPVKPSVTITGGDGSNNLMIIFNDGLAPKSATTVEFPVITGEISDKQLEQPTAVVFTDAASPQISWTFRGCGM